MKTKVKLLNKLRYYEQVDVGDIGYIDGHVQGADSSPYIVVIIPNKKIIVYASFYDLEVITE